MGPEDFPLCVFPVAEYWARRWLVGEATDADLAIKSSHDPQIIFWLNLPNRRAWKPGIKLCRYWVDKGAYGMVCNSKNPIMIHHLIHGGFKAVFQNEWGYRFWVNRSNLRSFLGLE